MHVHGAVLSASAQRWHCLAGIQEAVGIKRCFYSMEHFQFAHFELGAHLIDFFDTHSMLARYCST